MLETILRERHFTGWIIVTLNRWISRSKTRVNQWELNKILQKSSRVRGFGWNHGWNLRKKKGGGLKGGGEKKNRRNKKKRKIRGNKILIYLIIYLYKAIGLQAKPRKIMLLFLWKNYEIQIESVFWSVWGWHFNGVGFSKAAYYSPIQ